MYTIKMNKIAFNFTVKIIKNLVAQKINDEEKKEYIDKSIDYSSADMNIIHIKKLNK